MRPPLGYENFGGPGMDSGYFVLLDKLVNTHDYVRIQFSLLGLVSSSLVLVG